MRNALLLCILADDGKTPQSVANVFEWAAWNQKNFQKKIVAQTIVGTVVISTVFLGVDNLGNGLFFETMIFGGPLNNRQDRYPSWKEAKRGHNRWVKEVKRVRGK